MMGASPQVSLRFGQQRWQAARVVIARDLVVQVAKDSLNRIRFGAGAW